MPVDLPSTLGLVGNVALTGGFLTLIAQSL